MDRWAWGISGFFVLGLAFIGWQVFQPAPESASQGHLMVPPNTSKLGDGDPIVSVRIPAELSANAELGKKFYEVKCVACHGENAAGQNGVAPPLVHKIYEPSHHSDASFMLAAQRGVRAHHWKFGDMPPIKGLTQGDVKMIATYVRELQRENGIN